MNNLHKMFPLNVIAPVISASPGRVDWLKYAHENDRPWGEYACYAAAENGDLDCLKYLHKNGCRWEEYEYACVLAAENGHLECLKYLHENGCRWEEFTCCSLAAKNGHLECLKYLHENGCMWDEYTCESAAKNGHLECLKYAYDNSCPWDEYTCELAAGKDRLKCLKYLYDNGFPCIHNCIPLQIYDTSLDRIQQDEDNRTEICSICFTNIPKIKFLPCNHDSFCIRCSNTLVDMHSYLLTCPCCRSNVQSVLLIEN